MDLFSDRAAGYSIPSIAGRISCHVITFSVDHQRSSSTTENRMAIGAEIRIQVPILNVPFRLIYAYNPRARRDQFIDGFPFIFNEKKNVFRFSVGRTF